MAVLDCFAHSLALEELSPLLLHGAIHLPDGRLLRSAPTVAVAGLTQDLSGFSPSMVVGMACVAIHHPLVEPNVTSMRRDLLAMGKRGLRPFRSERFAQSAATWMTELVRWAFTELKSLQHVGSPHSAVTQALRLTETLYEATTAVDGNGLPAWDRAQTPSPVSGTPGTSSPGTKPAERIGDDRLDLDELLFDAPTALAGSSRV